MLHRRFVRSVLLAAATLAVLPLFAAEGRIPVFAPGTFLGTDGKYIVTRNIINPLGGPAIIIGAPNVDLDLNGHLIANPAASPDPVILVAGGSDHVSIRNGNLAGGSLGIDAPAFVRQLTVEDVKSHDHASGGFHFFDVLQASVRRVEIDDAAGGPGILWDGGALKTGRIEDSVIRRTEGGIYVVNGCSALGVSRNRIEEIAGLAGILLSQCSASIVAENAVETVQSEGIAIFFGKGNKLYNNVVRFAESHGIHIDRNTVDTLILDNVSSGNGSGGAGHGLFVEGNRNLIERNVLNGNAGAGLLFFGVGIGGIACENTFGRNTARLNTGAGVPACAGGPALFPPNSCNAAVGCAVPNSTYGDNLIPGPPIF